MEAAVIGIATAFNFIVILFKFKRHRYEDACFDLAVFIVISYMFAGIKVGMQSAILGTLPLSDGELSIPLRGCNTDLRVYIESDSWLPESFISAEWQGLYTTKVKQI